MLTELKTIFESVDKEILSEDTLKAISNLVEEKVNTKVEERLSLELENAIKTQYEKFKVVSEKAINAIDEDHTEKIKNVVNKLLESNNEKLLKIHEGYKKIIKETASKHRDSIIESVSEFLDMCIERNLPKEEIQKAAKNQYALKAVQEARKILGVDEKYIKDNIKEAFIDGKHKMDSLLKENTELKKAKIISESKRILAEKTANLPVATAKFVRSRLEGKPSEFIKENFQYVLEMFSRQENKEKKTALLNENKQFNVDRNRVADEILKNTEIKTNNNVNQNNPMENIYLSGLNFRK